MARKPQLTPEESLKAELAEIDSQINQLLARRNRIEKSLKVLLGQDERMSKRLRSSEKTASTSGAKKKRGKAVVKSRENMQVPRTGTGFFLGLMKSDSPITRQQMLNASLKKLKLSDTPEIRKIIGARLDNTISRMVSTEAIKSDGRGSTRTFIKSAAE